jgi:hypothetical protein
LAISGGNRHGCHINLIWSSSRFNLPMFSLVSIHLVFSMFDRG